MSDKIYIQIDNERLEATGAVLEQIIKDQEEAKIAELTLTNRAKARQSALAKLAALGLTEEEIAAL